jgi:hypothetical protein
MSNAEPKPLITRPRDRRSAISRRAAGRNREIIGKDINMKMGVIFWTKIRKTLTSIGHINILSAASTRTTASLR